MRNQSCAFSVNGGEWRQGKIDSDFHNAAYAAQEFSREVLGQHQGSSEVTIKNLDSGEKRTYKVEGFVEFKQSAREIRSKRDA